MWFHSRSSVDSPAGSQELPGGYRSATSASQPQPQSSLASASLGGADHHHHHHHGGHHHQHLFIAPDDDSDFETEPDPADWRQSLDKERRDRLDKRETKRQDVINGQFRIYFLKYF